jgi:hypothetical protein
MVRYRSGKDLLEKTPTFYQQVMRDRLNKQFNRAYRYIEVLYDGYNPYVDAIRINMTHLMRIIETGDWSLLRREPAVFVGIAQAVHDIELLVARQLSAFSGARVQPDDTLLMPV